MRRGRLTKASVKEALAGDKSLDAASAEEALTNDDDPLEALLNELKASAPAKVSELDALAQELDRLPLPCFAPCCSRP
jgi:hypothetical protein